MCLIVWRNVGHDHVVFDLHIHEERLAVMSQAKLGATIQFAVAVLSIAFDFVGAP